MSAAERSDERVPVDARLPQDPAQCSALDLPMERYHATDGATAQHHMAATLAGDDEAKVLPRTDGLSPRDVREFRQRRRCGTS